MNRRTALAAVILAGLAVLALGGVVADTRAAFLDSEAGTASVTAAQQFGGGGPPNGQAYNDANGNGRYDAGETTYSESDLYSFDNSSADLVIPESMGTVENRNDDVSITAGSITSDADLKSRNGDVTLEATDGSVTLQDGTAESRNGDVGVSASDDVDLSGSTLKSRNGDASVTAGGTVDLTGATLRSRNEDVTVSGETVTASDGTFRSRNGDVVLESEGDLTARDATLRTKNGDVKATAGTNGPGVLNLERSSLTSEKGAVTLGSNGDAVLRETSVTAPKGDATISLGTSSATLSVDRAQIDDSDDVLEYEPSGASVKGQPNNGRVAPG